MIRSFTKLALLSLLLLGEAAMATAWAQSIWDHGVNTQSTASDGSRRNDTQYERLGFLCDSLQTALNLTDFDVLPVEHAGHRVMRHLDETALRQTLIEIYAALGLEENLPDRFSPGSLRIIFDEILSASATSSATVQTRVADGLTNSLAILRGAVTDDGDQALTAWGFKFGTNSDLGDSIHVAFGGYQSFLDTSAQDTGAFMFEKSGLDRFTTYYYAAWAQNANGIVQGETRSFTTLPDLASGLSLDTSLVTATSATLELAISDAGGQGPDDVGFYWDDTDFALATFTGDSLPSDNASGTAHSVQISGLTRMTTYYFNAYADNLAGRAWANEHFAFTTKPEVPEFDTVYADLTEDSLHAVLSDDGGQTPTLTRFIYSTTVDAQPVTDTLVAVLNGLSFSAPIVSASLLPSQDYDLYASAENDGGMATSDPANFYTPAFVQTIDSVADLTGSTASLFASFTFGNRTPDAFGFKWGLAADLSDATDSPVSLAADSTIRLDLDGLSDGSTYYYAAYADNGKVQFGDTLSFVPSACAPIVFDGYTYDVVQIGSQCWFAENLRSDNYADGTPIPGSLDNATWASNLTGAQAIYSGDSATYYADFGRLYNWYAVDNPAGLCPSGWHVPAAAEIDVLIAAAGGEASFYATELKSSPPSWDGNNSFGFSGLPSGARGEGGDYDGGGAQLILWSGSSVTSTTADIVVMVTGMPFAFFTSYDKRLGGTVRCLQNAPSTPTVSTSPALEITDTTATLMGAVEFNGELEVTAAGFKWSNAADLSGGTEVLVAELDGEISTDLTGLTLGNTVYYAAFATNALGTSYGDTLSFVPTACTSITYDGYEYGAVRIGNQCWFTENLRSDNYADGTSIPGGLDADAWSATTSGAQAIFNGDSATYFAEHGRLYNWYAVNNAAGLCPTGWHVPTYDEFYVELRNYLGSSNAGEQMKSSPSDVPPWNGTNTSGFSAIPGGYRILNGNYTITTANRYYWTASVGLSSGASYVALHTIDQGLGQNVDYFETGYSVRCMHRQGIE